MGRLEQISLASHLEIYHNKEYTPNKDYNDLENMHERLHGYGDVEHTHKNGRSFDVDIPNEKKINYEL